MSASETSYMNGIEGLLDTSVGQWTSYLTPQQSALTANDAQAPDAAEISSALVDVNGMISDITTWSALPVYGVGTSRFCDAQLPLIQNGITNRTSQIPARAAQIITRLGSVSQAGDGSFTGTGQYHNFFTNVNIRVNKANGTLRNYYQMDLIIATFDQSIANITAQAARDSSTFTIKEFSANGNGTTTVSLTDTSGLVLLDSMKITSNTQPVIDVIIQGIFGLNVTLDVAIPSTYTQSDKARLVKVN
jgi:hypothetical protein